MLTERFEGADLFNQLDEELGTIVDNMLENLMEKSNKMMPDYRSNQPGR
jgi:hypothetical protein